MLGGGLGEECDVDGCGAGEVDRRVLDDGRTLVGADDVDRLLDADDDFRFICYVDSVRGVELMDAALRGAARPLDVVVELAAGEGARTGVRTEAECAAVADAVAAVGTLRLVGVAGYEGEVPQADPERVHAWSRSPRPSTGGHHGRNGPRGCCVP